MPTIPDSLLRLDQPLAHTLHVVPGASLVFRLDVLTESGAAEDLTGITAHVAVRLPDGTLVVERPLAALGTTGQVRLALTPAETALLATDGDRRGLVVGHYQIELDDGADRVAVVGGSLVHPVGAR